MICPALRAGWYLGQPSKCLRLCRRIAVCRIGALSLPRIEGPQVGCHHHSQLRKPFLDVRESVQGTFAFAAPEVQRRQMKGA